MGNVNRRLTSYMWYPGPLGPRHRTRFHKGMSTQVVVAKLRRVPVYQEFSQDDLEEIAETLRTVGGLLNNYFQHLEKSDGAKIRLVVCLMKHGTVDGFDYDEIIGPANFLKCCDSIELIGKRIGILVDDVFLEWGKNSLVIPRRVSLTLDSETAEIIVDSGNMKMDMVKDIIDIVCRYNRIFYYNALFRNSQQFIVRIIEVVLGQQQTKVDLDHEHLDAVIKKLKQVDELCYVTASSLQSYYDDNHKRGICTGIACQYRVLMEVLDKEGNLDIKHPYLDIYHELLATQECVEIWFFKLIFLGAPRLGKTTIRRRLTGEITDISSAGEAEQPSTGAIDSTDSIVVRNLLNTTAVLIHSEWLVIKNIIEEARMFLHYFHSHLSCAKSDVQNKASAAAITVSTISKPSNTASETEPGQTSVSPSIRQNNSTQLVSELTTLFHQALGPQATEIKNLFTDSAFINMEDTGGQPEFMDMLPALTLGPALYLLFCKLTNALQSNYKVSYSSPSGECTIPTESSCTMEEMIFSALSSIHCFKSFPSDSLNLLDGERITNPAVDQLLASSNRSVAYIVGTHKDLVSEQQIDEFDEKLQQSILPTAFFKEDIVQFSSEHRLVLPVDNMHGGGSEINEIRNLLEESLKRHFTKLSIPPSWLLLSVCLRKREERTASLDSVHQLAKELGMPEQEMMAALWFLHHYAGVLMYFPNLPELEDTIICNNQIVYDSATTLIVKTFRFGSVSKAASERFRKTGQFSLDDIKEATSSVSGDYIPIKKLVKLLEYLNILSVVTSTISQGSQLVYFMPCVLQNATHEELSLWWNAISNEYSPAPLFIRYKCGFVPIGVFPALIAHLAGKESLNMVVKGIKKNLVTFQILLGDYDTITLASHSRYYTVHITRQPNALAPIHEVCATVRELIESALRTVTSRMNYNFSTSHQLSFECPSHPGREHLCIVGNEPSPRFMRCLQDEDNPLVVNMLNRHLVWFGQCPPSHSIETCSVPTSVPVPSQTSIQPTIQLSFLNLFKWTNQHGQEQEIRLVNEVSANWHDFGLLLGVGLNQLDAWELQYRGDASKCWNKVMDRWLASGGTRDYPATWEGLYTLLNDTGFVKVAKELNDAVVMSHSTTT